MDLRNVLAQLRDERDSIDTAIADLERLAQSRHRPTGRARTMAASASSDGANHNPPRPDGILQDDTPSTD